MLEAKGETVTKGALMEAAWPGTIVEEGNLTVQVAALRKALGTREDGGEWIVTVPRVGYRLLKARSSSDDPDFRSPLPSLAVLPFKNLSGDPAQDYFVDGIVEDITTALGRFKSFSVIARNSSFAYKGRAVDVRDIARDLRVRYVLEGSVRKAGSRLRISAQLIDAEIGEHIWAENFDGALNDVFDVQDRITGQVAGTVHPKLRSAEIERAQRKRPDRVDAYDLFLQSLPKQRLRQFSANEEAYDLLSKAVDLDPHFAPALVDLALTLDFRVSMGWEPVTHDDRARAVHFARRAILDAAGDANVIGTASVVLLHSKNYEEAMQVAITALETNPNDRVAINCAAIVHLHVGDLHKSLSLAHRALELGRNDPGAHWILAAMAHAKMALGQFEEALQFAERAHVINAEYDPTFWMLIASNAQLGRMQEAHKWLAGFLAMHPSVTISRLRAAQPDKYPGRMAAIFEGLRLAGMQA
jgi:TolB-like protein/Tfp pilus assembly protein PilF